MRIKFIDRIIKKRELKIKRKQFRELQINLFLHPQLVYEFCRLKGITIEEFLKDIKEEFKDVIEEETNNEEN